ncbi:MAG: 30S ribosomal protein S6e [Methanocellales archaeon]|nr:30S ribosomal protein S6e [Methanocellales archaeon]MDD3291181.1 30S ribosomal protein S6e [Methanocellales archaeon]MDD5235281.1 30S ribosomal protein S6e [Methanocellales archaeon]MDD5484563.1 30S ribosomal protein S6e [Methanocellales archaeon]
MVNFRVVISDPQKGKAYQVEVSEAHADKLVGKRIGSTIDGELLELPGYELQITGGTDKNGFPMREDLSGSQRRKVLTFGGTGHHPIDEGQRRRKEVCGREISINISQINTIITKYGPKPIEYSLGNEKEN